MKEANSRQRRLAFWMLRRLGPQHNLEPLTGDLLEKSKDGQSAGWLWRQVFIAIGIGISKRLVSRWSEFCFALLGTVLIAIAFFQFQIMRRPAVEHLWAWDIGLRWPLSTVYDFGFRTLLPTCMAMPLLLTFLLKLLCPSGAVLRQSRTLLVRCQLS